MSNKKTIKILHVVRRAEGGIAAHVSALLSGLDDRFAQSLAAPWDLFDALPSTAKVENFVPLEIGDRLGPGALVQAVKLARAARSVRADIVHAHGYKAAVPGVIAAKLAGARSIVTGHNLFPSDASFAARASLRVVARLSDRIIAVSNALGKSLSAAGVDERKISVVPCGIDVEFCQKGDRSAGRAAIAHPACFDSAQHGAHPSTNAQDGGSSVQDGGLVVLCVARLTKVKGVEYLLRAAGWIGESRQNVRFIVAGDGPDRIELEELAEQIAPGMVTFLGYRDDIRDLVAAADVVAVPSLAEGYGLMAVEAMAAGRAVVASKVGGLADNISDGETGLLVPPGDAESLAVAIKRLLESPELRERLGAAAKVRAEKEFTVQRMIDRTQEVYICVAS